MFGYVIAVVIGLILLGVAVAAFSRQRPGGAAKPHRGLESQPVQVNQPAADEPTPDRSVTANRTEVDAARRHTPPA